MEHSHYELYPLDPDGFQPGDLVTTKSDPYCRAILEIRIKRKKRIFWKVKPIIWATARETYHDWRDCEFPSSFSVPEENIMYAPEEDVDDIDADSLLESAFSLHGRIRNPDFIPWQSPQERGYIKAKNRLRNSLLNLSSMMCGVVEDYQRDMLDEEDLYDVQVEIDRMIEELQ